MAHQGAQESATATEELLLCEHWQVGRRNNMPRNMEALEVRRYWTDRQGAVMILECHVKAKTCVPKAWEPVTLSRRMLWKGKRAGRNLMRGSAVFSNWTLAFSLAFVYS